MTDLDPRLRGGDGPSYETITFYYTDLAILRF